MAHPTHIIACGGFVFNQKGEVLLVRVKNRGYECPGGQVEEGETLEEGVLREIKEESGITARVRCLAGLYSNVGKQLASDGSTLVPTKLMADFICDYVQGEPRPSDETSEVLWIAPEKVLSYIGHPSMLLRCEQALNFQGRVLYAAYVTKPEYQLLSSRLV